MYSRTLRNTKLTLIYCRFVFCEIIKESVAVHARFGINWNIVWDRRNSVWKDRDRNFKPLKTQTNRLSLMNFDVAGFQIRQILGNTYYMPLEWFREISLWYSNIGRAINWKRIIEFDMRWNFVCSYWIRFQWISKILKKNILYIIKLFFFLHLIQLYTHQANLINLDKLSQSLLVRLKRGFLAHSPLWKKNQFCVLNN